MMSGDEGRQQILDSVKTYLELNAEAGPTIKRELDLILSKTEDQQEQILANAMSKLDITYPIKFP